MISLILKNQGPLVKNAGELETLLRQFSNALQFGGIGPFFSFSSPPPAALPGNDTGYMVQGKSSPPGRGFKMVVQAGYTAVELSSPLPTTIHDLQDMFTFAGTLANRLNIDTIENSQGDSLPRAGLPALFTQMAGENHQILMDKAKAQTEMAVTGIRYPIYLPESLRQRIISMPLGIGEKYFSAYLGEKQTNQYPFLWPAFSTEEGITTGVFRLPEEVYHIVQVQPFVPVTIGPPPVETVDRWEIELVTANGTLVGRMAYEEFTARLQDKEWTEFDEKYKLLRGLTERRMQQILGGE